MEKRLFLAINLPKEIKEQLFDLVLKLQKANKNKPIKWVEKHNFHLTLHFLGSVAEEKIESINQALEPIVINFPILNFSAGGGSAHGGQLSDSVNAFPDLNNPKVIFLEMKELNDGKTLKLQKEIGKALEELGFETDSRPFQLHLTLGRIKFKTSVQIPKFSVQSSAFKVQSVDLMESALTPQGPIYTVLKEYKLKS